MEKVAKIRRTLSLISGTTFRFMRNLLEKSPRRLTCRQHLAPSTRTRRFLFLPCDCHPRGQERSAESILLLNYECPRTRANFPNRPTGRLENPSSGVTGSFFRHDATIAGLALNNGFSCRPAPHYSGVTWMPPGTPHKSEIKGHASLSYI